MNPTVPVGRTCVTTRIRTILCATQARTLQPESNLASQSTVSLTTTASCPPPWIHPPVFQWQTYPFLSLLAHILVYLAAQFTLQWIAEPWLTVSSDKELLLTTHNASSASASLLTLSELIVLSIVGYSFVSTASMQRGIWHACCSRYGSSGELLKLVAYVPCLFIFGGMVFLLRHRSAIEYSQCTSSSPDLLWEMLGFSSASTRTTAATSASSSASAAAALIPSQSLPLTFLLSYFVGLHFTYLDSNAFLQSLGCKLPVPSLWKLFTRNEIIFCVCFTFTVVGASVPIIIQLAQCESNLFLLISYLLLLLGVILLADCTRTQQVRMTPASSSSSLITPGGADANLLKMRGIEMWRWKLCEITHGLIPPPPPPRRSQNNGLSNDSLSTTTTSPPAPIYFHLHHYIFGIFLLPLFRFPDSYSCLVGSGVCFAVLVEGVACWGMDPLLVLSRPIEPQTEEQHKLQVDSSSNNTSAGASASTTASLPPLIES